MLKSRDFVRKGLRPWLQQERRQETAVPCRRVCGCGGGQVGRPFDGFCFLSEGRGWLLLRKEGELEV